MVKLRISSGHVGLVYFRYDVKCGLFDVERGEVCLGTPRCGKKRIVLALFGASFAIEQVVGVGHRPMGGYIDRSDGGDPCRLVLDGLLVRLVDGQIVKVVFVVDRFFFFVFGRRCGRFELVGVRCEQLLLFGRETRKIRRSHFVRVAAF